MMFDAAHTAVLAMDCQSGIVSIYAKPPQEFTERASAVLRAARRAGMLVVHVQVGFRPDFPDVSTRNKLFAAIKSSPQHQKLFEGAAGAIHPALGPEPDDVVVTKHRVSAFTGTDLAMVLRARDTETVVLFGIATSGVVLSTLLQASDYDYRPVLIADCCADLDPVLHEALLTRLFPQRGEVLTAAEFVKALQSDSQGVTGAV
ncbi:MAG TPA: isochorismatase family cysteine hydrolase [Candidatus Acidoferrales bacterium]|nr:isochorismatase family cysteine hydrolase [Candidatus Acidoferrales bacterium]